MFRVLLTSATLIAGFSIVSCSDDSNDSTNTSQPQTTGDIVEVAAANENFSTLVDLVKAAELVETLKGLDSATVFAPTNEAFAKVPGEILQVLQNDVELLKEVLTYHVVGAAAFKKDITLGADIASVQGGNFSIDIENETLYVFSANGKAEILQTDVKATNGVIHAIDNVILSQSILEKIQAKLPKNDDDVEPAPQPVGDLVDVAVGNENFSTLVDLVKAAGLVDTLKGIEAATVFAPTNEAFAKVPGEILQVLQNDVVLLKEVLTFHVVGATAFKKDITLGADIGTLQGDAFNINVENEKLFIFTETGKAEILATDVKATNGVIHVIDSLIISQIILNKIEVQLQQ